MGNIQRTWLIVVCFLLCEILTGSNSSRSRREAVPHGSQDPSLQALGSLLGQLPAQDLTGSATDLARLMDSVSRAVGQGAQGPTGVGRSVGQGAQGPTGVGQGAQGPTGVGQGVGRSLDLTSVMEMANALQQNPEAGARFGRGSDGAMMEVFVETQSLDDLTRSEAGRRQLGQLNEQLEQAAGSWRQSVAMMQSVPRAQHALTTPGDLQAMLRDIAAVLSPSGSNDSNDTMAAVTQLLQTVEGLPVALKGVLHNVYNVLAGLQTRQPSTARDLQQVLASLTSSLQAVLGGGGSLRGADSVQRVMQMAVSSLQHGVELLNSALLTAHVALGDGALLQTLNDTRCLLTTLTRPHPDTRLALRCMKSLLHTALSAHDSDQIATSTVSQFLATVLNDPTLLRSAVTLLQSPSLDTALSMMQTVMTQLHLADNDVSTAHATLTQLTHNQQLLQALAGLLRSPESAALYGEVVEMLRNATVGDPLWQQVVVVVNDTLVALWTAGDAGQAADTLRHILTVLSHPDHPALPLSPTQRAFINMLQSLLDVMLNATTTTTTTTTTTPATPSPTPTPPVTATAPPTSSTTTTATTTTTTTTTTARPATTPPPVQTTSTSRPEPSSPAPATTRRSDTVDDVGDNGGAHVSLSAFSVALGVLVSAVFL